MKTILLVLALVSLCCCRHLKEKIHRQKKSKKTALPAETHFGQLTVHVQLPSDNTDKIINMMDIDTEHHCVFKEGFITNVVQSDGNNYNNNINNNNNTNNNNTNYTNNNININININRT